MMCVILPLDDPRGNSILEEFVTSPSPPTKYVIYLRGPVSVNVYMNNCNISSGHCLNKQLVFVHLIVCGLNKCTHSHSFLLLLQPCLVLYPSKCDHLVSDSCNSHCLLAKSFKKGFFSCIPTLFLE